MAQDDNEPPRMRGSPSESPDTAQHDKESQTYETFSDVDRNPKGPPDADPTVKWKRPPRPTITDGFQSIKSDDFFDVHKIPCARQGFITGIGAGTVLGVGRYFAGGRIPKAANWAFGAFFLSSIIQWEYCRSQRAKEHASIARIVEIMDKKAAEKAARAAEAARLKQEEKERQEATKKSWYKFF